jgi:hypothetical protein
VIAADGVRGNDKDERKAALDFPARRCRPAGQRLPRPRRQPLGERAHRLGLAVGAGDRPRPTARAVALGHREARAGRIDARLDTDREHVLELEPVQPRPEARVVAVGLVGEDRRGRDPPVRCLLDQATGKLGLRLEVDRGRDLRPHPPQLIHAPLLRQVRLVQGTTLA